MHYIGDAYGKTAWICRRAEIFAAAAATGSFTVTGERLHLSQSAVSQQIRLLEDEVGEALFVRGHRRVKLTYRGEQLLPAANELLAAWSRFQETANPDTGQLKGRIVVGTSAAAAAYLWGAIYRDFGLSHPHVEMDLKSMTATNASLDYIQSGELDFAFVPLPVALRGTDAIVLGVQEGLLCAASAGPQARREKCVQTTRRPSLAPEGAPVHYERHRPEQTTLYRLVRDGVYRRGTEGEPVFVEVPAPTDDALHAVLHKIITRTMKLLTRRGVLIEEQGQTYLADNDGDSDEARTLRPLQAAACTYRIAFGPRAGQKVLTQQGAMPREPGFEQALCANMNGFSLHEAVRCAADDRKSLEQLCRYITRPPCRPRRASGPAPRQARTVHRTVRVRARRWPTNACNATRPVRWCSS